MDDGTARSNFSDLFGTPGGQPPMPGMGMQPGQTAAGGSGMMMGMPPAQTAAGAPGMMGSGAGYPGQQPPTTPYGNVMPGAGGMGGVGGYGGGQLGINSPQGRTSGAVAGQAVTGLAFSPDGALAAQDFTRQQLVPSDEYAVETHFASLDVDLPQRGREYLFTTPRGDIEITARAVSEPLLGRLIRLLILAVGVVILIVLLARAAPRPSGPAPQPLGCRRGAASRPAEPPAGHLPDSGSGGADLRPGPADPPGNRPPPEHPPGRRRIVGWAKADHHRQSWKRR